MTLVRWDLSRELEDMSDQLNRMFSRQALPQANGKETMVVADWVPSERWCQKFGQVDK